MDNLASCGVDCGICPELGKACSGCYAVKGEVFWAPYLELKVCPLYDCAVNKKHFHDCSHCSELPCQMFFDCRDPSVSVEEHKKEIGERVKRLRALS